MKPQYTQICLEILSSLISTKKIHLKYKIEPIVQVLNFIINNNYNEENKDIIKKTLTIYRSL